MSSLIEVEKLIRMAKKEGVSFGKGDPYNRLRYYTKIGWLPHMERKRVKSGDVVGHYPKWVLSRLVMIDKLKKQGSHGLQDRSTGPKTNYKRTSEATKQVIRHRFLDPEASCEVIAQKMNQSGHPISQRSVERIVQEYGLQKKGYIKQIRQMRKNS